MSFVIGFLFKYFLYNLYYLEVSFGLLLFLYLCFEFRTLFINLALPSSLPY